MSLTRLKYRISRPAARLVLLLVLVGQGYAVTHAHTHPEPLLDASECLVCQVSAGIDDADVDASRCPQADRRTPTLSPIQPSWPGFDPCRIANARAPPVW